MNAEGDMEFQIQASSIKPDAEIYKILSNATLLNKFFRKYNFFFHKISCKQVVVNITYKTGSGFVTTIYLSKRWEPRGFSRVAAGFSSYDGDLSLPLGLWTSYFS